MALGCLALAALFVFTRDMFTLSYLEPEQIKLERSATLCVFHSCDRESNGKAYVRVGGTRPGLAPVIVGQGHDMVVVNLCAKHLRCAERMAWPNEEYRYFNYPIRSGLTLLAAALLFLLLSGILHLFGRFPGLKKS
jgi:hypothetical protein